MEEAYHHEAKALEGISHLIFLTEEPGVEADMIYRYQKLGDIRNKLLALKHVYDDGKGRIQKKNTEIYGVLSAVGGAGKTTFALTLGQILSEYSRVLYIDLNPIATIREGSAVTLSELIFYSRQKRKDLIYCLSQNAERIDNVEILCGASGFTDLREWNAEDVDYFLKEITGCGIYEKIILDIGCLEKCCFQLLSACQVIYGLSLPWNEDVIRRESMKRIFLQEGEDMLFEKICWKTLPMDDDIFCHKRKREQWSKGILGNYIRGELAAEGL